MAMPIPAAGGSYIRDPKTGRLQREDDAAIPTPEPEPEPAPKGGQ